MFRQKDKTWKKGKTRVCNVNCKPYELVVIKVYRRRVKATVASCLKASTPNDKANAVLKLLRIASACCKIYGPYCPGKISA